MPDNAKIKKLKKGNIVGVVALKNAYDQYVLSVIDDDYLKEEKEQRGRPAKFKVIKTLPSAEEYLKLKAKRYTVSVQDLIDDATSTVEELACELREWYDNLPEQFQSGDKGQTLDDGSNTLESITWPDSIDICNEINTVFFPSLCSGSRANRASEAVQKLTEAAEAIQEYINDADTKAKKSGGSYSNESLETLKSDLDSIADEIDGVEFPGMY